MYSNYPDDYEELVQIDRQYKAYNRALLAHPDPRDPDHPEPEEYGVIEYEETHMEHHF